MWRGILNWPVSLKSYLWEKLLLINVQYEYLVVHFYIIFKLHLFVKAYVYIYIYTHTCKCTEHMSSLWKATQYIFFYMDNGACKYFVCIWFHYAYMYIKSTFTCCFWVSKRICMYVLYVERKKKTEQLHI